MNETETKPKIKPKPYNTNRTFTAANIDTLREWCEKNPLGQGWHHVYSDAGRGAVGGLKARHTGKNLSYCLAARFPKKKDLYTFRVIARVGTRSLADVRKTATQWNELIAQGLDPDDVAKAQEQAKKEQEERRQKELTSFREAFALFLSSPKKKGGKRSEQTQAGYRKMVNLYLKDWLDRPLAAIDGKEARLMHKHIGETAGTYAANAAFRVFRAVWNRARRQVKSLPECPTENVDWFEEKRRQAAIPADKLADWYKAVMKLENPVRRDYLRLVLHTGLRRESAACLRWDDVDFAQNILHVRVTKGDKPFELPLTGFLLNLLKALRENETVKALYKDNPYIFPSRSKTGHISEPREDLNVRFTTHSLRYSFASTAAAAGVNPYHLKLLLNHAMPKNDVTAGYINAGIEDLRRDMEVIGARLQSLCEPNADGKIILLRASNKKARA